MTDSRDRRPVTDDRPEPLPPARFGIVRVLAATTAVLGVVMIVLALAGGGGLGSYGVLVGAFFLAAGILRLRLVIARSRQ